MQTALKRDVEIKTSPLPHFRSEESATLILPPKSKQVSTKKNPTLKRSLMQVATKLCTILAFYIAFTHLFSNYLMTTINCIGYEIEQ